MNLTIAIGADHRGYELKSHIIYSYPRIHWVDVGAKTSASCDYPIFAAKVCDAVASGPADIGILICGSGIGMSIAANRYSKIYAALCWSTKLAIVAKNDDCANILVLPANFISNSESIDIVNAFISTPCSADERYQRRRKMIDE